MTSKQTRFQRAMEKGVSVIIRTYNEAKYLGRALGAIRSQECNEPVEVIVVDSGSNDNSPLIAENYGCKLVRIAKDEFSFGRSLNLGCSSARGEFLVFISGHCIPVHNQWLQNLIEPLKRDEIAMSYGRQVGGDVSKFSELQLFKKYFPKFSQIPQAGFFCNNANAAIKACLWREFPYDEDLTGLEDMDWAKRVTKKGYSIAYVADAPVEHLHEESWKKVRLRYEREALALQKIMPEVQLSAIDFVRYFLSGVLNDWGRALFQKKFFEVALEVLLFRFFQYYGSYMGNHEHRRLSKALKERYFYPR